MDNKRNLTKQDLLRLFYKASQALEKDDYLKVDALFNELIGLLPFKNLEEKKHYIDIFLYFKFWEDLESETIRIINNLY